jgi:hypothetical protein
MMNLQKSAPHLVLLAAVAVLSACNGGGSAFSSAGSSSLTQSQAAEPNSHRVYLAPPMAPEVVPHPDHRKSWVSPDVARLPRLLFVSDTQTYDVYIFTMPAMQLRGTLTGFNSPAGLCSDRAGNIWIVNAFSYQILKYSRAGKHLKTLHDPAGTPFYCAVNPINGDLAVTNATSSDPPVRILIYRGASGTPDGIAIPDVTPLMLGYDTRGNLYFDGRDTSNSFALSVIPAGSDTASPISVKGGTIYWPGMVQWNRTAKNLVVGDQLCGNTATTCLYSISISGSDGTITGTTNLSNFKGGQVCDIQQGVLGPHLQMFVAGGDWQYCGYAATALTRWLFPSGGMPTNYNDTVVQVPTGVAISNK